MNSELANTLLDEYAMLELIIHAPDSKQEAEYQKGLIKTKLETMGITTTNRLDRKDDK
ncbi:MAG: hypothetical protein NC078_06855 [Ruminococcus sp.]|nr:hypothetical protein [Ruminococcus sp.]